MAENRNILDDFKVNHEEKTIDTNVKLRVGIIGCGWIAEAHLKEYLNMPDVEVVAFADLVPGKAEAFAKQNGTSGRYYLSHADMLDNEELDAVREIDEL